MGAGVRVAADASFPPRPCPYLDERIMRKVAATTVLLGSLVGLVGCILFAVLVVLPAYDEFQATGDSAGLGLGRFFLLYWFLPLGISGLSLASLVWPRRAGSRHHVLSVGCLIAAGLSVAQAVVGYGYIRPSSQWPYSGAILGLLLTRDIILFLPLLLLALLLVGNAVSLLRRRELTS